MKRRKIWVYILFIAIPLAVGGLSALITNAGMPAFDRLQKPSFTPPSLLFPIVWSILYLLMGIGGGRVWRTGMTGRGKAIVLWAVKLLLNFFWTVWFFTAQLYLLAFLWLVALIAVIAAMIVSFSALDKLSAWLQVPYLLWCSFAAVLNFSIWLLNG